MVSTVVHHGLEVGPGLVGHVFRQYPESTRGLIAGSADDRGLNYLHRQRFGVALIDSSGWIGFGKEVEIAERNFLVGEFVQYMAATSAGRHAFHRKR